MDVRYLSMPEILYIHDESLRRYGGRLGVWNQDALDAAIARPQMSVGGSDAFPTLFLKSATYLDSFARNHPFVDGNKRTGYTSTEQFLRMNGILLSASEEEAYEFVIHVVTDRPGLEDIAYWIELHCTCQTSA